MKSYSASFLPLPEHCPHLTRLFNLWPYWVKGAIEDRVMEGHRFAQTVAYGDLGSENPALITPSYERHADPVIELQLKKAHVRAGLRLER